MLINYLKVALRNLYKQRIIAFINIFGLSLGIACFSLFLLYAVHEFSFDGYHKNVDDIFLVVNAPDKPSPEKTQFILTSMPLGQAMKKELPGVKDFTHYIQPYPQFVRVRGMAMKENVGFAEPSFFSMFSFTPLYGDATNALNDGSHLVISEETALRLFGKSNAIGELLQIKIEDTFRLFTISAVVKNPPSNSFIQFGIIAPFSVYAGTGEGKWSADSWGWNSYITFVQLDHGSNLPSNEPLIKAFKHIHFPNGLGSDGSYSLLPLKSLHVNPGLKGFRIATVDPQKIWLLCGIAAAILLIACINFTTLAIGRSARRAKEVGVRKISGGTRASIAWQFLMESELLAIFSTIIGLVLAQSLLPWFNQLADRQLSFSFGQSFKLFGLIALMMFIVGIISGSYPALILSGLKAIEVLKTRIKLGGSNLFMRSLVVTQFVLSTGLIIGAVIIMQQLNYMQSRNPGFEKENVIVIRADGISDAKKVYLRLKQELARRPEIESMSAADNGLGQGRGMLTSSIDQKGKSLNVAQFYVDPDYVPTLKMQLLAGRNFAWNINSDTVNAIIINETLMHGLGLNLQNSIGHVVDGYTNFGVQSAQIIGVVKDYNFKDYSHQVEPMLLYQFAIAYRTPYHFFVRIPAGGPSKSLATLQSAWKKAAPDYPLEYHFLDEDLDRFYTAEQRLSKIIGAAGAAAILLACLGLLGLTALGLVNRTKEIGIRKVLGASIVDITSVLSKELLRLVFIAIIIALPFAGWIMDKWLQNYPYRINMQWWVFALSAGGIILLSCATIGFMTIKAVYKNPVNNLREE